MIKIWFFLQEKSFVGLASQTYDVQMKAEGVGSCGVVSTFVVHR